MLLQIPTTQIADTLTTTASEAPQVVEMNYFDMAMKGGPIIMIPLLILSIIAVYIFIERLVTIRKASKEDKDFMDRIKDYITDGNIDSATKLCQKTNTPSARMIEKGISRLGKPMNDVLVAIENVGNIETNKLEKGFNMLATISGGAPMLGFLGTVMGMVQAFFDMANAGNNVDITVLSNGIYTAMITTVAGLVVGIVAYFAYNYLVSKLDSVVQKMELKTMEFMDLLNEPLQ
ncbi:MAG: MotA/TolQ/ExbB proton channel family protein [Paludibacteraceae bacterium]|nr:MotA/TolQ/ExbB proton channel family protein [Paludibacteraceae bacterium]MBQ1851753.1 MotA/TolQ/ExbB proton channel family protein [Paludibacteraceae bacterium]MBQ2065536.1 MotA/TolQ/ExbB proton channel family protein [Paludibacteraceae bacterium]